ncbi:MAG: DUF4174 domain-containing protein [Proteobacteria bacterium]|nr:DUF4174 domain-containing protein [Pseudomonadota bacterium]
MGLLQPLLLMAGLTAAGNMSPSEVGTASMDNYIWKSRPLIVFTPTPGDPLAAGQRAVLDEKGYAFRDRDMILVEVIGDRVSINGQTARGLRADDLRARYRVARDMAQALLVGKDGGVKLRSKTAFSANELFATIDAMPMRQREMHRP